VGNGGDAVWEGVLVEDVERGFGVGAGGALDGDDPVGLRDGGGRGWVG